MKKKILVLIFGLMCCSHIPNVRGMERIEETIYFDELTHQFTIRDIYLQKGEVIFWSYETYDSPFTVKFVIPLGMFDSIVLSQNKSFASGEFEVLETKGNYMFWFMRYDDPNTTIGYLHLIVENKSIPSFPLVLLLGIIGLVILIKIKRLKNENEFYLDSYKKQKKKDLKF